MKKTSRLLLTLFLVAVMLFGFCAPTLAYTLTDAERSSENNSSEPQEEGGGLDLKWFTVEYTEDKITLTLRPDVKSLLETDKADIKSVITTLTDAIKLVVVEDIKQGFIDDQYGDDGGVNVDGININNVWKIAIDNYVATLGDDVKSLDSDPYVALFKAAVKNDGNTLIDGYISYACTLVKFACKAGYITVEELDSHTDDEYRSKVEEIVKTEIEKALKQRVAEYADKYVAWLVDDVAHGLDADVEKIINDAVVDYVIDLRDRYIDETLDLSNIAEKAFSEYVYEEFNRYFEEKMAELVREYIEDNLVTFIPGYDETLPDDQKAIFEQQLANMTPQEREDFADQVEVEFKASAEYAEFREEKRAEAWEHKGDKITESVQGGNAIEYLHTVLHSYKATHPDYFAGVKAAIVDIANDSTAFDMSKDPIDGDIRDEAFKIALGIGHREFNDRIDGYITDLLVALRATVDEVRDIDTEIGIEDALEILLNVKVNGNEIYGPDDEGINYLNIGAVKALVKELPTPAQIRNFTLAEMALSFDVVIATTVGTSAFNLTFKVGSGDDKVRALAKLVDEYVELSVDGTTVNVGLRVPAKATELLLRACNSTRISDDLKIKIFGLLDNSVDDFYNELRGFTFDEIKDIITSDSLDFVRNSDFINKYINIASLSDDEIIAKLDKLEPYFNRAWEYADRIYDYVPDEIKNKTVFDIYKADGRFSASGTRTVERSDIEKVLTKISSKYGEIFATYIPEFSETVTVNAKLTLTDVHKVEYVVGSNVIRGFLPAGADVAFFANTEKIDGKEVLGWADESGAIVAKMPARDVVLVPVFDQVIPDIPSLPEELEWNYSSPLIFSGEEYTVELIGIDERYYNVVYTGNTATAVGKYTATAVIYVKGTSTSVRVSSINWEIRDASSGKPELPAEIYWDYSYLTPFIYDGELKTVKLRDGQIDERYYEITYTNNAFTEVGIYVATATITDKETGYTHVLSLEWKIAREISPEYPPIPYDLKWTYSEPLRYTGENQEIFLLPGQLADCYTVAYENNIAKDPGRYCAKAIISLNGEPVYQTALWWEILAPTPVTPVLPDVFLWTYSTPFQYTGEDFKVRLVDGQVDLYYYDVSYENANASDVGVYHARAIITDKETGLEVRRVPLVWEILPTIHPDFNWDYDAPFVFDGTEQGVDIDLYVDPHYYNAVYSGQYNATEPGVYYARVDIYSKFTHALVKSITLHWTIRPVLPDNIGWDATEFVYDGENKSVRIDTTGIDLRFFKIVYSNADNTAYCETASDFYRATAEIRVRETGELVRTLTNDWRINYVLPAIPDLEDITWTYDQNDRYFIYNGNEKSVFLDPSLFHPAYFTVNYTGNSATEYSNPDDPTDVYSATAEVVITRTGEVVYTADQLKLDWQIRYQLPDLPDDIEWNYLRPFVYDGEEKTVKLKNNEAPSSYYRVEYKNATKTEYGSFTAVAEIYERRTNELLRTVTLDWKIDYVLPELPDYITWDYTTKFIEDGTEKTVKILDGEIDSVYYEVRYSSNSYSAFGRYTAKAEIVDKKDGIVWRTLTLDWEILPEIPTNLEWTGEPYYLYNGDTFTIELKGGQLNSDFYTVNYLYNSYSAVGTYLATAEIMNDGVVVARAYKTWQIIPEIVVEWDYEGDFYYDGSFKSVALKMGIDYIYDTYYYVEYTNNKFIGSGRYTATATVRVNLNGDVVDTYTLNWRIIPDARAELPWTYVDFFTYDGEEKKVELDAALLGTDFFDFYEVVYTGNVETEIGNHTAIAKIYDKDTEEEVRVIEFVWQILPPLPEEFVWDYTDEFKYDGEEKSVALVDGQVDREYFDIVYTDNAFTEAGRYVAYASIVNILTGRTVATDAIYCAWNIYPEIPEELTWDTAGYEFYNGELIEIKLADGIVNDSYYTVVYTGNTATDVGFYTAKVQIYDLDVLKKEVTFEWRILPDISADTTWNYDGYFLYDGEEKSVSYTDDRFDETYFGVLLEGAAKTEIGNHTAALTITDKVSGDVLKVFELVWQILPTIPEELNWNGNPSYNADSQSVTIKGGQVDENYYTLTYTENTAKYVGSYTAKLVITNTLTGEVVKTAEHGWNIVPCELDLSKFSWAYDSNMVYTGKEFAVTVKGYPAHVSPSWFVYTGNTGTNAGSYTASAVIVIPDYIADNYTFKAGTAIPQLTWSVAKADIDLSYVKFNGGSFVYDGKPHSIYVTSILPKGVFVDHYEGNGVTEAGVHTVTAVFGVTDPVNYNVPAEITAEIRIYETSHSFTDDSGESYIEILIPGGLDPDINVSANSATQNFADGIKVDGKDMSVISAYDVTFFKGNEEQAVNGRFSVKLRIPDRFLERDDLVVVHIDDDGNASVIESARDGDYMVFDVTHFSIYAIVTATEDEAPEEEDKFNAWLILIIILLVILLIVAIIIILKKRKKDDEPKDTEPDTPKDDDSDDELESDMKLEDEPETPEEIEYPDPEEPTEEPTVEPEPEVIVVPVEEPKAEEPEYPDPETEEIVVEETVYPDPETEPEVIVAPVVVPEEEEKEPEVIVAPVVVPAEEPKEEPAPEAPVVPIIIPVSDDDGDGIKAIIDGEVVEVRYRSSFQSRLIQSDEEIQNYYTILKNKLLSYKGVKARTSWNFESFNKARVQCAKLNIKGKAILLYINLDTSKYNASKYHFQDVSDKPKFADVPMMLKVKSDRGLKYAIELIEELMSQLGIPEIAIEAVDYRMPYESTEALAKKGLIKMILPKGVELDENMNLVKVNVSDLIDASEKTEEAVAPVEEIAAEPVIEEPAAEEVVTEEPAVEEPVVEQPIVVEHAHVKPEEVVHVDAVHADEILSDDDAEMVIEHIHTDVAKRTGKLEEINLDIICENFEDGETVTVAALIEKRLVPKKTARVKVLARGVMTKALTVVASKFSLQAVKMITLAGGVAEIED